MGFFYINYSILLTIFGFYNILIYVIKERRIYMEFKTNPNKNVEIKVDLEIKVDRKNLYLRHSKDKFFISG